MITIEKTFDSDFPFKWVNLDYLPASNANRTEIYLINNEDALEGLISMFHFLLMTLGRKLVYIINHGGTFV